MADTHAPVITLKSLTEPRCIRIGDQHYDLRNPGALFVRQQLWLEINLPVLWETVHRLTELGDAATDDDEIALVKLADRMVEYALDAPVEVRQALTMGHKLMVIRAFVSLPSERSPKTSEAQPATGEPQTAGSTGNGLSRGFSASTAAIPLGGSSASLSH